MLMVSYHAALNIVRPFGLVGYLSPPLYLNWENNASMSARSSGRVNLDRFRQLIMTHSRTSLRVGQTSS